MRIETRGDSCVACAARLGHLRVLQRLLAAGAKADAPALPPPVSDLVTTNVFPVVYFESTVRLR